MRRLPARLVPSIVRDSSDGDDTRTSFQSTYSARRACMALSTAVAESPSRSTRYTAFSSTLDVSGWDRAPKALSQRSSTTDRRFLGDSLERVAVLEPAVLAFVLALVLRPADVAGLVVLAFDLPVDFAVVLGLVVLDPLEAAVLRGLRLAVVFFLVVLGLPRAVGLMKRRTRPRWPEHRRPVRRRPARSRRRAPPRGASRRHG